MTTRKRKTKTRSAILTAAVALFYEKGYQLTTVQEITNAAKVAKGTFFNHFPTKESILHALAEERLMGLAQYREEDITSSSYDLLPRIRASLLFLLKDYDIHPALTAQIWKQVAENDGILFDHWKLVLEEAELELTSVQVDVFAHIINSHIAYGMYIFKNEPTRIGLVKKVMTLVETSFEAFHIEGDLFP